VAGFRGRESEDKRL